MILQTGSDILTSCHTYDELACPRDDEKHRVFENTNRLGGGTDDWMVGRSDGGKFGRSGWWDGMAIERLTEADTGAQKMVPT